MLRVLTPHYLFALALSARCAGSASPSSAYSRAETFLKSVPITKQRNSVRWRAFGITYSQDLARAEAL